METHQLEIPTTIGDAFAGGFYAGRFCIGAQRFALIVASKAAGEHEDVRWNKNSKVIPGAKSFNDGCANTLAMVGAGSALAQWAVNLRSADFDDWYLPSRDELELLYRHFKPTAQSNYVWRNGDNPSSLPPGYPYNEDLPAQSTVYAFRSGGAEAFTATWYWSSTQSAGDASSAWYQYFNNGYQYHDSKVNELRARAVRRVPIE